MTGHREIIFAIIDEHAEKARNSEYDRSVAITAISTAREVIAAVPLTENDEDYAASVLSDLHGLMNRYRDPDGVYASGKGVLGALIDDIRLALRKASD